MKKQTLSLIQIHIAVFLFGFSGLFGKLINQSPITIVFGRSLFGAITLMLIIYFFKKKFKLAPKKNFLYLSFLGIISAIHWISFYQSVQISNVAIAVLTFSTFPIFVTFIEPYIFREKIRQIDIITAFLAFAGIAIVIPSYELSNNITQGAIWGIIAGLTAAFMTIYNKIYIKKYSSILISFYQCAPSAIILIPALFFVKPMISKNDFLLLVLLGVIFTAISHTLFIKSVEHIKAQLASIITCLEPVYGIILAVVVLKEIPTLRTTVGGLIIIGTILYATSKSKIEIKDKTAKLHVS